MIKKFFVSFQRWVETILKVVVVVKAGREDRIF
jgi:hypothetical protein